MDPVVPYQFEPTSDHYEEEHLVWEDASRGHMVSWSVIGARIFVPKDMELPLEELAAANNSAFKSYGQFGFTLGNYSEFFVSMPDAKYCGFKMAGVEASFGDATPLAALIFDPFHREKWFGTWDTIMSLRIFGVGADEAEIAFLNGMTAYEEKFGILPDLFHIDPNLLFDGEEAEHEEQIYIAPPMVTNLDPLRFYYNGMAQVDDVAACIYFYRTLEYFSFFTNATEMNRLRHDSNLSDADFSRKLLDLVSRDEKGPLFRLITSLADTAILEGAVTDGLIKNPVGNVLCEALYAFRNSIVHGKFSYGYSLLSGSVLHEDTMAPQWKVLLRKLARLALDRYGARRT